MGGIKIFCFTVDDNIRFLKEIKENNYKSIFEHPYLAMYKRLHSEFGLKVQLNLFYQMDGFNLSQMSDAYYDEWVQNADWLKLSFHSKYENKKPYEHSSYDEVYEDCYRVNEQIKRFASDKNLAKTTTIHYCLATIDGIRALSDNQVKGLLGLFGKKESPRTSYGIDEKQAERIRNGETIKIGRINFSAIEIILNCFSKEEIIEQLKGLKNRNAVRVMIHEQYFYKDYPLYQPDFEEKLRATFSCLTGQGRKSCFYEELID